jgi:glutamine amidotransferase
LIGIIDASVGNIGAFTNILKRLELPYVVLTDENQWSSVSRFILPGVGAFDTVMKNITDKGFDDLLNHWVLEQKRPLLGICVGAQILCESSEEGRLPGLGWIQGKVKKFSTDTGLKVPHMGWNTVTPCHDHDLFSEVMDEFTRFYFLHSYCLEVPLENRLCQTTYGETFSSGIYREQIFGLQFHPEKSHRYGIQLINNFCKGEQ